MTADAQPTPRQQSMGYVSSDLRESWEGKEGGEGWFTEGRKEGNQGEKKIAFYFLIKKSFYFVHDFSHKI